MSAPFNRRVIEDALRTFVVSATGLDDARVFWERQAPPQPRHPYAVLNIISNRRASQIDETRQEFNAGTNKIDVTTSGLRLLTLSINAYSRSNKPETDAYSCVDALQAECGKRESDLIIALREAGIAIAKSESVDQTSQNEADAQVSRAHLDVMICIAANQSDEFDWIETVIATSPEFGITEDDPLTIVLS